MYSLCVALSQAGHRVVVFADGHAGAAAGETDPPFQLLRYTGLKAWRRRKKARDIARFARQNEVQGLIADSWKSLEHLDTSPLTRVICLAHGSELPQSLSPAKSRRIISSLEKATAIVANSNFTALKAAAFIGNQTKLRVIYPGIDPPKQVHTPVLNKAKQQLAGHNPVLISIARLDKRKGQHRVLKILPGLLESHPDLLYVMIGDGPYRNTLECLSRELQLQRHVLFTGTLQGQIKNAYLQLADLFVMPSFPEGADVEGFGIAYLEAAGFGIPSVAGDMGGSTEAVLHGETGLICHAEDQQALLTSVNRLLDDQLLYQQLSENARKRAQLFEWQTIIKEYEQLLGL
jgi:phosphatidylinositol alpha-1,6-mannosyltransferase